MKHIEGPWLQLGNIIAKEGYGAICQIANGTTTGNTKPTELWDDEWEQGMANARLIAVAPELLEACKDARIALRAMSCTCNDDRDCHKCITFRKVTEAIAKTEPQ